MFYCPKCNTELLVDMGVAGKVTKSTRNANGSVLIEGMMLSGVSINNLRCPKCDPKDVEGIGQPRVLKTGTAKCTCGWKGSPEECHRIDNKPGYTGTRLVCPKCGETNITETF